MNTPTPTCSHCGRPIRPDEIVYGDHERKYCGEKCAAEQLDEELGPMHHASSPVASAPTPG